MNTQTQLSERQSNNGVRVNPTKEFNDFMNKLKPQMALALPSHMKPDRMARLALTAFSSNPDMQKCDFRTIASSLMTAGALGLEPGVNGAGYLIPYKTTCTFVPGWKGLVDLVSRSGRATVWTGAVFEGDEFDYALGDRPFVKHRPGDETDPSKLIYVYAIGRVNGSDYPVIEVWSMRKVWKHRDTYNKVGKRHYSYQNHEMYARKVPLLQVLKYMPCSIEVANAIAASDAAELGKSVVIEGNFVTVSETSAYDDEPTNDNQNEDEDFDLPPYPPEQFAAGLKGWLDMIATGKRTPDQVIRMLESKGPLSDTQKAQLRAGVPTTEDGEVIEPTSEGR